MVGFGLGWAVKGGDGRVEAQAPHAPFMMQRIYTGTDGLSHVENIELDAQSVMEEITGMSVRVSQPGSFADWHVGPGRRYIINLTGGGQLEAAEGKVDLPAERWTLKFGQLAKVESRPRKRSLACHGRDGVIPLS